jgi:chromate reductase, NAD(P)H dehydrogenase (quinone)
MGCLSHGPEVFIHFTDDLIALDGKVNNSGTERFLQSFVDRYVAWIKRFTS